MFKRDYRQQYDHDVNDYCIFLEANHTAMKLQQQFEQEIKCALLTKNFTLYTQLNHAQMNNHFNQLGIKVTVEIFNINTHSEQDQATVF